MSKIKGLIDRFARWLPPQPEISPATDNCRPQAGYGSLWVRKVDNSYSRLELETIRDLAG